MNVKPMLAIVVLGIAGFAAFQVGRMTAPPRPDLGVPPRSGTIPLPHDATSTEPAVGNVDSQMRAEVPMPQVQKDVSVGEVAPGQDAKSTHSPHTTLDRFPAVAECLSDATLNPGSKALSPEATEQLRTLIAGLNRDASALDAECRGHIRDSIKLKLSGGDWREVAAGTPVSPSAGAIATSTIVGQDGKVKAVELFPNENALLDDALARKSALFDHGRQLIHDWIAAN